MKRCTRCGAQNPSSSADDLCFPCRKEVNKTMDDVQNTTQLQFDEGASLRKQMGLITPSELATALGVSEITLQIWRQKGNGPRFTKLGKNIFYPMREVQHWTETNILDRVRDSERAQERLYPAAPQTRYKTGEAEIDSTLDALTKLIEPNDD